MITRNQCVALWTASALSGVNLPVASAPRGRRVREGAASHSTSATGGRRYRQRLGGWRHAGLLFTFVVLLLPTTGCIQMAAVWANWTGGDVVKPQFALTKGSLLVLVEDQRGVVTQPRALRKVHKTICEKFAEFKVNREVVPLETSERLQRTEKAYEKLSVRQIGEKLGAEQVLHISARKFSLRTEPGAPLFKGEFVARVKLLSTEAISDNRLWPREPSGRRVAVTTHPTPTDGDQKASDVAGELATKLGESVAKMFYEHRELDD